MRFPRESAPQPPLKGAGAAAPGPRGKLSGAMPLCSERTSAQRCHAVNQLQRCAANQQTRTPAEGAAGLTETIDFPDRNDIQLRVQTINDIILKFYHEIIIASIIRSMTIGISLVFQDPAVLIYPVPIAVYFSQCIIFDKIYRAVELRRNYVQIAKNIPPSVTICKPCCTITRRSHSCGSLQQCMTVRCFGPYKDPFSCRYCKHFASNIVGWNTGMT